MPLKGGNYAVKTTPKGAKIRLHFTEGGTVNEAKVVGTTRVHTPAEFQADRKRRRAGRLKRAMTGLGTTTADAML
jgi:hypothetical protein